VTNEALVRENAELRRQLAERDILIGQLQAELLALRNEVAALKEALGKSSRNSSKPPSSDGPAAPLRKRKRPTGRKPGGQPGHQRHERELVPIDKVNKVVECIPECCDRCGKRLHGKDPNPERHQVSDLPKVEPVTDEYRLHSLGCSCGHTTRAKLPAGVPTGAFGPTVVATAALLMGVYRLGKRLVPQLLDDLFGLPMSTGAVIGCQRIASEAIAVPVQEATSFVRAEPIKHADETSWREGARRTKVWLWTAVTACVTVFCVQTRRNTTAARELLGKVCGVLVSDRFSAYLWWPDRLHQFCWAHLKRDVTAISEREGESERLGKAMLEEIGRMFAWWHRVRDGTMARSTFRVYMRALQRRFEALLAEGAALPACKTSRTCKKILRHSDALWTFVRVEGVEPTNNTAERTVRHGVILRNISGGTHSQDGSRFIERILTVHATLRQQRRPILPFLRDACQSALLGKPGPSLLPPVVTNQPSGPATC